MANLVVNKLLVSINDATLKNLWHKIAEAIKSDWQSGVEFYIFSDEIIGLIGESYKVKITADSPIGTTTRLSAYICAESPIDAGTIIRCSDNIQSDGSDLTIPFEGVVAVNNREAGYKAGVRVYISGENLTISELTITLERVIRANEI